MNSRTRLWVALAAFQVAFGLAVFALTRHFYLADRIPLNPGVAAILESPPTWPGPTVGSGPSSPGSTLAPPGPVTQDPAEISRQADEAFSAGQYDRAAALYERLLAFDPKNVGVYNNLGLTLHYLGRSAEALQKLGEGLAIDPQDQRSWLTTGFVNSQLGNTEQARTALTKAAQTGTDEQIRESARQMLAGLPPAK